ncbi:MAG: hypothetical protein ACR2O6_08590 [Ilumatobacteraceae bacterium]
MTAGLLLTSLLLGLRHGMDWDHIAAIADLSGTAENRRRGFVLSFLYAVGHALVVFVLGCALILLGTTIPDRLDEVMGRVVGATLVALGVWVLVGLVRHGRDFRPRSQWMLIFGEALSQLRRVRTRRAARSISVDHDHDHDHGTESHASAFAHDHAHMEATTDAVVEAPVGAPAGRPGQPARHRHGHRHELALPTSASARYGNGTAAGIGMLHGVGIESPTQIAVFVASTSVVGAVGGIGLLVAWIVGLVVANSVLALLAGVGVLHAERSFAVYATVAVLVAFASIAVGVVYLSEFGSLPGVPLPG